MFLRTTASLAVLFRMSSEGTYIYSQLTKLVSMLIVNSATSLCMPAQGVYVLAPVLTEGSFEGVISLTDPYRRELPAKFAVALSTALTEWWPPYICVST